jgi:hypothetical protein
MTPNFPFAGWMLPLFFEPLIFELLRASMRAAFAAVFADLFRVAIFWPLPQ